MNGKLIATFVFTLIFISANSISFAGNDIKAPEWFEFCPSQYIDANIWTQDNIENIAKRKGTEQTKIFYCKPDGKVANVVRWITLLPALDCSLGRKIAINNWKNVLTAENENNKYWYERRIAFNDSLKTCANISKDSKALCYMKIREIENQKNYYLSQDIHNRKVENLIYRQNLQNAINSIQESNERNQINTQLQNINNNIQNTNRQLWNINNSLMQY